MNAFLQLGIEARLAIVAALGVVVGSALNAAIYRYGWTPRPIGPWSRRRPDAPARRPWDFLPLVGWFALRRERALHGRWYWLRPLFVELLTAAVFAGSYWWEIHLHALLRPPLPAGVALAPAIETALHVMWGLHAALAALLIVASFIDFDDLYIPDVVTVPGTLLALVAATLLPWTLLPDAPWAIIRPPAVNWPVFNGLPDPNPAIHLVKHREQLNFVHLTSPVRWPAELDGVVAARMPLATALASWTLWCFALLPRRWRTRRGFDTAMAIFLARLRRDRFSWLVGLLFVLGCIWICLVFYRLGPPYWRGLLSALVGMATSAAVVWGVRIMSALVLRKEAMGFGDVTLMAMIGAFVGWQAGLATFLLAPFFGLGAFIAWRLLKQQARAPFGPFLCLGAAATVTFWPTIWGRIRPTFEVVWVVPLFILLCGLLLPILLFLVQGVKALFRPRGEARLEAEA